jgi:hypothetical protein
MVFDNEPLAIKTDDEKKKKFLIELAHAFYDNHNKKVGHSITFASLLITANGIILLCAFNLFQFLMKNGDFSLIPYFPYFQILFIGDMTAVLISIYLSILFLNAVIPISFDLSPMAKKLKEGTYEELLDASYDIITDYSSKNRRILIENRRFLNYAMLLFCISVMLLIITFSAYTPIFKPL